MEITKRNLGQTQRPKTQNVQTLAEATITEMQLQYEI